MKFTPYIALSVALFARCGLGTDVDAGSTPEDACVGLDENDPCAVQSPLMYTEYGTCQWVGTATEAPSQTQPPNPANAACSTAGTVEGAICTFLDTTTGLPVEGICRTSTAVDFDGLTCEPDGNSEVSDEVACDGLTVGATCSYVKGDGLTISGECQDTGTNALKCEQAPPGSGGSDPAPDTGAGGGGTGGNIAAMDVAEVACLVNKTNTSYGFLEGTNCSFVQGGGIYITGTCVSKEGGAYSMCESDEEGTAAGGTEANNPEYIACVGLAVDANCTIVEDVTNTTDAGVCKRAIDTGDLKCEPLKTSGARRRASIYLKCHITSGGGQYTSAPATTALKGSQERTTTAALGNSGSNLSFSSGAGPVVGGVIGGLVALAAVGAGGYFAYRKINSRKLGVNVDTEGGDVYQTL